MNDSVLRDELERLLRGGQAHLKLDQVLEGLDPDLRNIRPLGEILPSIWEELEHMRISQDDVLCSTLDPKWKSPTWPDEFWPKQTENVSNEMWEQSVKAIKRDLEQVIGIVQDESLDLTSTIPHSHGNTYLRQILLVADHNAYHLAQMMQIKKLLGEGK